MQVLDPAGGGMPSRMISSVGGTIVPVSSVPPITPMALKKPAATSPAPMAQAMSGRRLLTAGLPGRHDGLPACLIDQ